MAHRPFRGLAAVKRGGGVPPETAYGFDLHHGLKVLDLGPRLLAKRAMILPKSGSSSIRTNFAIDEPPDLLDIFLDGRKTMRFDSGV
jgi:hypothetical protein